MKRTLSDREKRLLGFCLLTIFIVINVIALREFNMRHKALTASLDQLTAEVRENEGLLSDRAFIEKRKAWLKKNMPYTNSAGKAQGQLLEDLQNAALENELKISNQTLLEPLALDHFNEVAVNIRIRGDQEKMLHWLVTLQSPEKFTTIKSIELELDNRAKEKTPQAQCNLTIARWFNTEPPPQGASPVPAVAPVETTSPLEIISPLESAITPEKSQS